MERDASVPKESWESPRLVYEGDLDQIVLAGGGKLSGAAQDSGDNRKTPPSG